MKTEFCGHKSIPLLTFLLVTYLKSSKYVVLVRKAKHNLEMFCACPLVVCWAVSAVSGRGCVVGSSSYPVMLWWCVERLIVWVGPKKIAGCYEVLSIIGWYLVVGEILQYSAHSRFYLEDLWRYHCLTTARLFFRTSLNFEFFTRRSERNFLLSS